MVDDGREVGGSVEAEVGEAAGVGLGDALHPWGDEEQRAGGGEERPADKEVDSCTSTTCSNYTTCSTCPTCCTGTT